MLYRDLPVQVLKMNKDLLQLCNYFSVKNLGHLSDLRKTLLTSNLGSVVNIANQFDASLREFLQGRAPVQKKHRSSLMDSFGFRVRSSLIKAGVTDDNDLLTMSLSELKLLPGIGSSAFAIIASRVGQSNRALWAEDSNPHELISDLLEVEVPANVKKVLYRSLTFASGEWTETDIKDLTQALAGPEQNDSHKIAESSVVAPTSNMQRLDIDIPETLSRAEQSETFMANTIREWLLFGFTRIEAVDYKIKIYAAKFGLDGKGGVESEYLCTHAYKYGHMGRLTSHQLDLIFREINQKIAAVADTSKFDSLIIDAVKDFDVGDLGEFWVRCGWAETDEVPTMGALNRLFESLGSKFRLLGKLVDGEAKVAPNSQSLKTKNTPPSQIESVAARPPADISPLDHSGKLRAMSEENVASDIHESIERAMPFGFGIASLDEIVQENRLITGEVRSYLNSSDQFTLLDEEYPQYVWWLNYSSQRPKHRVLSILENIFTGVSKIPLVGLANILNKKMGLEFSNQLVKRIIHRLPNYNIDQKGQITCSAVDNTVVGKFDRILIPAFIELGQLADSEDIVRVISINTDIVAGNISPQLADTNFAYKVEDGRGSKSAKWKFITDLSHIRTETLGEQDIQSYEFEMTTKIKLRNSVSFHHNIPVGTREAVNCDGMSIGMVSVSVKGISGLKPIMDSLQLIKNDSCKVIYQRSSNSLSFQKV